MGPGAGDENFGFSMIFAILFRIWSLIAGASLRITSKNTFCRYFGTCLIRSWNLVGFGFVDFEIMNLQNWKNWKSTISLINSLRKIIENRRFSRKIFRFFDFVCSNAQNLRNRSAWNLCGSCPVCSSMRKQIFVRWTAGGQLFITQIMLNPWFFDPPSEILRNFK